MFAVCMHKPESEEDAEPISMSTYVSYASTVHHFHIYSF